MVRGRKVVGSAQLRQGDALLQHGSILLGDDQTTVGAVTRGPAAPDLAMPLQAIVGTRLEEGDLMAAISRAAARRWEGVWHRCDSPDEIVASSDRHAPRYRSRAWTWGV